MRNAAALTAILLLTGCTYYYYPAPVATPVQHDSQAAASSDCREFRQTVMIGGQPHQATGQACPQPDGTWKIQ
jgi:surface antigen